MPRLFSLLGLCLMLFPVSAADFPPPEKLPSQPDFPDPLVSLGGTPIRTADDWNKIRKPELLKLFQHYMYGQYPSVTPKLSFQVIHEDPNALEGTAILRDVEVTLDIPDCPKFHILFVMPKGKAKGSVPVFCGLNFSGNHSITTDPKVALSTAWLADRYPGVKNNKATEESRGKLAHVWPLKQIVEAGYALATVHYGEIEPDVKETRGGLRPFITPLPQGDLPADFPATIICWAWGLHRIVDFVQTVPEIDPKRIAAVGHSRLGKTTLLAAVLDDRIAVAFPHQAGCGGTGPSRHNNPKAEGVKRINTSFPHWFSTSFKSFNDDTSRLPFDQHCLVALCAPRPVLYTNATDDEWANPQGQFDMLKRATPVYKLLGVEGIAQDTFPETGKLVDSRLGYWIRAGKHEMNPDDWTIFLKYADKWLK